MLKKLSVLSFLLLFSFFSVNATLTTNLQSYYSFNDIDTFVNITKDLTQNTYDGILYNGVLNGQTGILKEGYLFDGINDYISSNLTSADLQNSFSFSVWINPSNINAQNMIIDSPDLSLQIQNAGFGISNSLLFVVNTPSGQEVVQSSPNSINPNTWTYVVGVWDSSTNSINLYINGVLDNAFLRTNFGVTGIASNTNTLSIGKYYSGSLSYFNGLIDEVGIFNRVLTQSEVTKLYNNGAGLPYSSFVNPINLVVNTPINNFNYTYDVPQVLFNISTSISTSCSYTYNNVTTLFSNTGGFNHSSIFNLPAGINQTQTFNIEFGCTNTTYSQYKNITFYKQQVPLALDIIVPQENQIFNIDTSQIEFYLQTNYVTDCNYKRDNDTFYTPFTSSHSWEHKSNFTTDLNISTYNMNFFCTGVYVNENVSRNITFFLDNLNTYSSMGLTRTSKQLPQVGNDIGNFMKNSTPGITEFIFNLGIVSILVTLLVVVVSFVKTKLK